MAPPTNATRCLAKASQPTGEKWRGFQMVGWEPLENATTYYSPSKGSGAMTTYYYDKKAGIAYHDAGYW